MKTALIISLLFWLFVILIIIFVGCSPSQSITDQTYIIYKPNLEVLNKKFKDEYNDKQGKENPYEIYLISKIDSLIKVIHAKDTSLNFLLQNIESAIENLSDQGLQNLIELRKK